ncbi:hypothetical protein HNP81_003147 [Peribacillus huizhouensis]|uniref:ABC transmembrane type-1 domain-containing protein n=1 Tax=Peribacillus huizhouensis TaxID=1501239 RepID=A0ABR6CTD5_9BACI|nr:hypothetical protein [Peribacillus huizhouensis]
MWVTQTFLQEAAYFSLSSLNRVRSVALPTLRGGIGDSDTRTGLTISVGVALPLIEVSLYVMMIVVSFISRLVFSLLVVLYLILFTNPCI